MQAVIFGAGTYSEVYLSYLLEFSPEYEIVGFLDDNPDLHHQKIQGLPILGGTEQLDLLYEQGVEGLFCPIGDNAVRLQILRHARNAGMITPSFIHPSVNLSRDVSFMGTIYILAGSTIMPHAHFEDGVMISMMVSIAHHTILNDGVFVSTGCNVGAGIDIGTCAYLGIGSTVMTGVKRIGEHSLVGAGAVVISDVEPHSVVAGVPAKVLRTQDGADALD